MLRKAEEALQLTKRVMNPWEILALALDSGVGPDPGRPQTGRGSMEANNGDVALPRVGEPE